jgi:hypothetical protein
MKKLFLFVSLFVFSGIVQADVPRPEPSKTPKSEKETTVKLFINARSEMKEPTLVINRKTLKQLRAALDEAETNADFAEKIDETPAPQNNFSRSQTLIAGMFFSLAFIVGGVWMFRTKGKSPKIAIGLIIFAVFGAGTTVVFANAPPPEAYRLTSRIFSRLTKTYGYATGNVKVKIVSDDNDRIYLNIPKDANDPDLK